jgi:hypothetical protein
MSVRNVILNQCGYRVICSYMFSFILLLIFVAFPVCSNAEAWEVTVEENNPNPRYYAGEGYGYYRRVPDKEIYYAPDIYVSSDGNNYYYQLANLKPGEKVYLPFEKIESAEVKNKDDVKQDIKYTTSLVYYPKGLAGEYLRNPIKKQDSPQAVKKDSTNIYPLYFD